MGCKEFNVLVGTTSLDTSWNISCKKCQHFQILFPQWNKFFKKNQKRNIFTQRGEDSEEFWMGNVKTESVTVSVFNFFTFWFKMRFFILIISITEWKAIVKTAIFTWKKIQVLKITFFRQEILLTEAAGPAGLWCWTGTSSCPGFTCGF